MRPGVLLASLGLLAGAAWTPAPAVAAECAGSACGIPSCWEPSIRARPGMARAQRVQCSHTTAARLVSGPAHGEITDITLWTYGFDFKLEPEADAPRFDEAVFELIGPEGSIEQRVGIENVPASENSPPVCDGDAVSQRSDGRAPVSLFMHPYCRDPDEDDFVMYGGGPGFHPNSPLAVMAGESESNWPYRTATHSGTETGTVWAVDSLGARSPDAPLTVTVGPGVNRAPTCRPNPAYWSADGIHPVASRPGATRRFGIICEDADADLFGPAVSAPPERGVISLFAPDAPSYGFWGVEIWIDAAYVPADESLEPDPFTVSATAPGGGATANRMAIVPRELPDNHGGGCGYSGVQTPIATPAVIDIRCGDDEGDPLSAEVVDGPRHGTVAPELITPSRFGDDSIVIPYEPDPGFQGYDCVKVQITDGHGLSFKLTIDIWVVEPDVGVPALPEVPDVGPIALPVTAPGTGPAAPASDIRNIAERALSASKVKRIKTGRVELWAPARLSRRRLLRERQAAGLLVVCRSRCEVSSRARMTTGRRELPRRGGQRTFVATTPAEGRLLWVGITRPERRALRRARRARATFDLALRVAGARRRSMRHSVRIGR